MSDTRDLIRQARRFVTSALAGASTRPPTKQAIDAAAERIAKALKSVSGAQDAVRPAEPRSKPGNEG